MIEIVLILPNNNNQSLDKLGISIQNICIR